MSAIDAAAKKVDDLTLGAMSSDRITVDPADPWADIWNPPPQVYKERCPHTGYLMTKPFEQNNPMPGQFDQTSDYIVSMLKPVIKPKDGGAKAKAAAADAKPKKEKKEKAPKTPQPASDEDPFVKARLVIAKVLEVGHVENSDKLYCCKVQVGPEEIRQVITGLRKFVPEAELTNKMVLCITNLKVAKLAGQTSEAMILATTCELNGELSVKVVNVPETATVGDVVGADPEEALQVTVVLQEALVDLGRPEVAEGDVTEGRGLVARHAAGSAVRDRDGAALGREGGAGLFDPVEPVVARGREALHDPAALVDERAEAAVVERGREVLELAPLRAHARDQEP